MITFVEKRDGEIVPFEKKIISGAIYKAFDNSEEGNDELARQITESVIDRLNRRYLDSIPNIEDIQDIVEEMLISYNFRSAAKAYITYRYERNKQRTLV